MAETTLSAEKLQEILRTVISEARRPNELEQRKLNEELEKDRRRNAMMLQLGKIEEEAMYAKRNNCSHTVYAAGDNAGMSAPKGAPGGRWCTGGQALQDGTALVICLRCSSTWRWRPSPEEYGAILQNGLLRAAPPPDEYLLCDGCSELRSKCVCKEKFLLSTATANVPA